MKKTAIITGASSGFGVEFAKILAAQGYDLIISARSVQKLENLKASIESNHKVEVEVAPCDLSIQDRCLEFANKYSNQNIDVLINNAGVGTYGPFIDSDIESDMNMMTINMNSLTILCKTFIPNMVKRGSGRVLNIASTAAFQPGPLMSIYFATKAYVLHFSEGIQEELRGTGVSVTAYCPGATKTGFQATAGAEKNGIFNGNLPTAQEVAKDAIEAMNCGASVKIHGLQNRIQCFLTRFTPRFLVPKIVKFVQRRQD